MEKPILITAALFSIAVAILHIYVIYAGAPAYRAFGAGEQLTSLAEKGSWLPTVVTSGITAVFFIFAAYYLAAAGFLPELPFFRFVLIGIAAIYTLRGAMVVAVVFMKLSPFEIGSSLVSLVIGLVHCAGVAMIWPTLANK